MHLAAITQPVEVVVDLMIRACETFNDVYDSIYAATCYEKYSGIGGTGPYLTQLFAKMSMATGDMHGYCYYNWDTCALPSTIPINETQYFKPKPTNRNAAPAPSSKSEKRFIESSAKFAYYQKDKTINVLHLSDWHLDPRYDIGSEANCSQYLCCRPFSTNTDLDTVYSNASVPASRFGFLCCSV